MTTTKTKTKTDLALSALRKNTWISSDKIKAVTGETDLRSVRRLRATGTDIEVRKTKAGYQYKRVS